MTLTALSRDLLNKYTDYAQRVINGDIVACQYVKLACQRYLDWMDRDDMVFIPEKVERVVNFIGKLRHFTGKMNGKPFVLSDFQFWIICAIFGFYRGDRRVVRNAYIELARKNGKSFFASAIALYMLIADGENNAEVELVANSTKQAKIVFQMCKNLVDGIDKKHKYFKSYRDNIRFDYTKSFLQVLSSDAGVNDGWNSLMTIIDEYHSAKDDSMYNVMKSSQGNRESPLMVVITTAGFNLFSPCYQLRRTNIEILQGVKTDDTVFAAIYTLDDGDDWQDSRNFIKANPNLGVSVNEQWLEEQITQAKNNSSLEVGVRTKNLNQWISSSDIWINNDQLLQSTKRLNLRNFSGLISYVGVDLAAVSDLTAVCALIPKDGLFYFKIWYYLPQSCLFNNSNAELYKKWERLGYLTITAGNVTDYDYLLADLLKLNDTVYIEKVAYDSYNATQWAINSEAAGLPLEPFSQALWNFNRPTKELERLIKCGKVVIDDNEITRWCFSNVSLKIDYNENVKPIKTEKQQKIDGVVAMIQALGAYLGEPQYNNTITAI